MFYDKMRGVNQDPDRPDLLVNDNKTLALACATRTQQWAAHPALVEMGKPTNPSEAQAKVLEILAQFESSNALKTGSEGARQDDSEDLDLEKRENLKTQALAKYLEARGRTSWALGDGNIDDDPDHNSQAELFPDPREQQEALDVSRNTIPTKDRTSWLKKVKDMSDLEICSSRVKTLLELHQKTRTDYSEVKIVVFSKFLKFLDLLEEALSREAKVEIFRFDGTKDLADRTRIKSQFGITKGGATIMITPGSGGSGLNLTAGTQLIQCEVWWNGNEESKSDPAYIVSYRRRLSILGAWRPQTP